MAEMYANEERSKDVWHKKYSHRFFTEEEQAKHEQERATAAAEARRSYQPPERPKTEKEATLLRLQAFEGEGHAPAAAPELLGYQKMRQKVAADVAMARPHSHRITNDLTTPSMLVDISPGLWSSVNPGGAPSPKDGLGWTCP